MPETSTLLVFTGASLALILVPGPAAVTGMATAVWPVVAQPMTKPRSAPATGKGPSSPAGAASVKPPPGS